jgi:hypothetical protein
MWPRVDSIGLPRRLTYAEDMALPLHARWVVCCLPLLLAPRAVIAWQHYQTSREPACGVRWYGAAGTVTAAATVPMLVDQGGLENLSSTQLLKVTQQSAQTWNAVGCGAAATTVGVQVAVGGLAAPTPVGGQCLPVDSETCVGKQGNGNFVRVIADAADWPYGSMVFGLTVLTYNTCSGQIVDGDILLDDARHDFCSGTCTPGQQDLCNTLTHEMGHLLGLDHSAVAVSTMFASAPAGETQKCSIEQDDRLGLCAAYGQGCGVHHTCGAPAAPAPPADEGCAAGRGAQPSAGPLLAIVVLALARRRRTCAST